MVLLVCRNFNLNLLSNFHNFATWHVRGIVLAYDTSCTCNTVTSPNICLIALNFYVFSRIFGALQFFIILVIIDISMSVSSQFCRMSDGWTWNVIVSILKSLFHIYIYIYIYMFVCVCICTPFSCYDLKFYASVLKNLIEQPMM